MTGRRRFLFALACTAVPWPARATPETMAAAIRELTGGAPVREGRVHLDLPPLVENGNSVTMVVSADSPMTEADHVRSIHVFSEKNPLPQVVGLHFGPRSGVARASTRIRLADSQRVTAIARMSDGSFWSHRVEVIVTIAACLEELPS